MNATEYLSPLVPGVLVTGVDGARLPVRPVQRLIGEGEGKGMGQGALHHSLPVDTHRYSQKSSTQPLQAYSNEK